MRFFNVTWTLIIWYTLAYGLMLAMTDAVFWDGWTIFNAPAVGIASEFREAGYGWFGPFLIAYLSAGVWAFHLTTFLAYLGSGFLLLDLLRRVTGLDAWMRFWIVAFFLLFPVNIARIEITTTTHAISHFLFFFAVWLLTRALEQRSVVLRGLALAGFLLSFFLNSLVVFYALVIVWTFYLKRNDLVPLRRLIRTVIVHGDIVLLPVIFWIVKNLFFRPYGLFAEYNAIRLGYLPTVPMRMLTAVRTSLVDPLIEAVGSVGTAPLLFLAIAVVASGSVIMLSRSRNASA